MVLPLLFVLSLAAFAQDCPRTGNAPACPTSGVRILDETYPIQSFVISYMPYNASPRGLALPARTMVEAMRAYNFNSTSMPMIIFPASAENFRDLRTELLASLQREGKTAAEAEALINQRVRHVEAQPWTWQQDYFESTFDQQTGGGRINYSQIYSNKERSTQASFDAMSAANICGLSGGPMLNSGILAARANGTVENLTASMGTTPTDSAEYGGNMEGLPGGLCLVGDNMTDAFAEQICGNRQNIVKIEANWLEVGHVDEIMKVLPDRRNVRGRPPECAFTIASADTELGLSLLRRPSNLNRNVLNLDVDPELLNASPDELAGNEIFDLTFDENPATRLLCDIADDRARGQSSPERGGGPSGVRSVFIEWFAPSAHAAAQQVNRGAQSNRTLNCLNGYNSVSGREFLQRIDETPGLREYNTAVQNALVRGRQRVYDSILARLPQCRPFFRTMDDMFTKVPNIFSPKNPNKSSVHIFNGEVGHGSKGFSFFPNPTNSVLMNNSVLFPGPVPPAYRDYLDQVTRARGLTPAHLDTWDYAHSGQGNIHCSSHSIPYCRPGGRQ